MYTNDLDPARVAAWQRLGFPGDGGALSLILALVEGVLLAVITVALNGWRLAIAWVAAVLALQIARRIQAARPHTKGLTWIVLLIALVVIIRPEIKTLGQNPIVVTPESIRPGVTYYDPGGHVLVVYRVDAATGDIWMMDGHPDGTLTQKKFSYKMPLCLIQVLTQQISKELMIAEPLTLTIKGKKKEILFFQSIKHILAVFLICH